MNGKPRRDPVAGPPLGVHCGAVCEVSPGQQLSRSFSQAATVYSACARTHRTVCGEQQGERRQEATVPGKENRSMKETQNHYATQASPMLVPCESLYLVAL